MSYKFISVTDTAKLIRQALKAKFPGQKFSVRSSSYSGGASIDISYIDGPILEDVEKITKSFAGATFDGMTDMKSYHSSELNGEQVYFGADFVFTNRQFSKEKTEWALNLIIEQSPDFPLFLNNSYTVTQSEYSTYIKADFEYIPCDYSPLVKYEGKEYFLRSRHGVYYINEVVKEFLSKISFYKAPTAPEPTKKNTDTTDTTGNTTVIRSSIIEVRKNEKLNGIEVVIISKVADSVFARIVAELKGMGFRYSKFQKIWYTKFNEELFIKAQCIA